MVPARINGQNFQNLSVRHTVVIYHIDMRSVNKTGLFLSGPKNEILNSTINTRGRR